MSEIFTPDFLLKYIYKETNANENKLIAEVLNSDITLKQLYQELIESTALLDELKYSNFINSKKDILEIEV